jgi:hypothetical protein
MKLPVFTHTISAMNAVVNNEREPLQKISELIKYDPGLYFSLIQKVNSMTKRMEVAAITQAISLIGSEGLENHILEQEHLLGEEHLLLWCYSVLAGETASLINGKANIGDAEEAFFAGILPSLGMLFMLIAKEDYKKILDFILRIPLEDRIFIEEKLYKTNNIEQLDRGLSSPRLYKEIVNIMLFIFSKDGRRTELFSHPAKLSFNYKSFQLFQLMDATEYAVQAILFPYNIESQEKFKETCKRYFKIPENEAEELLADVIERFEDVCKEFKVGEAAERFIVNAEEFRFKEFSFLTKSESLKKSLDTAYEAAKEEKNILLYGEASVGKRLLAMALHNYAENPRKTKPILALHCGSMDSDTLELELFGTKGGFLGLEKHKGALEIAQDGGTILLKDIDKIPVILQDRLTEILSEGGFHKIGETRTTWFDVRFIITSRKNIAEEAKEGRFSERLLNILNPVGIHIPPLRERREDIEFIADSIIEKYDLALNDKALRIGLKEYYETHSFRNNLEDLKRLLFFLSVKHSLKS